MKTLLITIGGIIGIIFLILYTSLVWGFVCYKFWTWFILPVFVTLPNITFLQAVGISFFISLLKTTSPKIKDEEFWNRFFVAIINPWMMLGLAYLMKIILGI